ncbi:MAG: hypothetical protein K0V04_23085 [Deltaproteobacteria bacterium]|nr:hypothetical protein [Deltaproteobacteria bacterium]
MAELPDGMSHPSGRFSTPVMTASHRHTFVDFHPGPGDATAHFAEETMARAAMDPQGANGDTVTMNVSHLESPSVQTAWRLRMAEIGITLTLDTFFEGVPTPDPRVAKGAVDFVLWQYEGTKAKPALGAPDTKALEAVAAIARTRYHLPTWADAATVAAQQFGDAWAQHLLATMLHPPAAPDHVHPLDWVPRIQVAAALVIAMLPSGHRVLQSVAMGPVDWTVDAAIIALGELALRNPQARPSVEQLFTYLRAQVPTEGFTSYPYALVCTWQRLVPVTDPRAAELAAWREKILRGEEGGTVSKGSIGMIDGLNMEVYAEFCVKRDLLALQGNSPTSRVGFVAAAMGAGNDGSLAALAADYGVPMQSPLNAMSTGWAEAINRDPRLGLAFEQTKSRIKLSLQGIDPDSDEARLSHNLMAGKGLDQEQELHKAQAAQQQLAAGDGGEPDPTVFPGQPVARLSDYVGLMKHMQGGDFNGALAAYGLDMGTYSLVMQAWGTKLGVDPSLNAKFGQMMAP